MQDYVRTVYNRASNGAQNPCAKYKEIVHFTAELIRKKKPGLNEWELKKAVEDVTSAAAEKLKVNDRKMCFKRPLETEIKNLKAMIVKCANDFASGNNHKRDITYHDLYKPSKMSYNEFFTGNITSSTPQIADNLDECSLPKKARVAKTPTTPHSGKKVMRKHINFSSRKCAEVQTEPSTNVQENPFSIKRSGIPVPTKSIKQQNKFGDKKSGISKYVAPSVKSTKKTVHFAPQTELKTKLGAMKEVIPFDLNKLESKPNLSTILESKKPEVKPTPFAFRKKESHSNQAEESSLSLNFNFQLNCGTKNSSNSFYLHPENCKFDATKQGRKSLQPDVSNAKNQRYSLPAYSSSQFSEQKKRLDSLMKTYCSMDESSHIQRLKRDIDNLTAKLEHLKVIFA